MFPKLMKKLKKPQIGNLYLMIVPWLVFWQAMMIGKVKNYVNQSIQKFKFHALGSIIKKNYDLGIFKSFG